MDKPKLSQRIEQSFSLSPQQLIKANILQLNSIMLETRLYQELESNPALEISENDSNDESEFIDDVEENESIDFNEDEHDNWIATSQTDSNSDATLNLKNQSTITEQVISVLRDDNLSEKEIKIAEQIVGNLDQQGYLEIDSDLISDRFNIPNESVLEIIEKIKHSKFPGLASSNIRECLIAQLSIYNISPLASKIIEQYFDDFMNRRYEKIMKKVGCTHDELQKASTIISQLNPNPRAMIDETDYKINTIIPDVILEKINNKWNVIINDGSCPNLLVSENYLNMYNDKNQTKDVKIFLKSKIESAQWFIEAIQSRNHTMQNIVASIINKQDQYFNSDQKELKPMILKDIANHLNIDISTVSRATKEKYIQMPWGIKELKFFFSKGLSSTKGEVSSKNVKEKIKTLIDTEDKLKPFGDGELTNILNSEGINIARRTVAKYREKLNYSVARLRKELK
jgi:RNA polymerase sigma-54 factor